MRYITYALSLGVLALMLASCDSGILDQEPRSEISEQDVWADPNLVEAFVNSRYNQIGHGWPEGWMSSVTDETYMTWPRGESPITQASVSPGNLGRMNGGWYGWDNRNWDTVWGNIQQCNDFLANIDEVPFTDEVLRERLTGEVIFIRALMYLDLVQRWGAMPLITEPFDLTTVDQAASIPRNTYAENVNFLVAEADRAAELLPASYSGTNAGRATSVAALALKSRILLYAASPLMNEGAANELVGYASPPADRWQRAADAARAVIDAATANGYALYNKYPDDVKENYTQLYLDKDNPEVLFARQNYGSPENMQYIDQANGPNGHGQWGGNTPTGNFVDAFQWADGTAFSWDDLPEGQDPWEDRDPRLKAFVLTDGDVWMGTPVETHYYETTNDAGDVVVRGGIDTEAGPEPHNASQTGYNMRKFLSPNYVPNSWFFNAGQNWIWFRLAEAYLNYAEAQYHLGNEGEARWALNLIRERAGMPEVTASGDALWEHIVYERRIELAFEEHRYFDIRRWMIADDVMEGPVAGIDIMKKLDGTVEYEHIVVEEREFEDRMYWLPIPQGEMDRSTAFVQNPGY